jgi:phenylalanine-4-hydroxylase
MSPKDLSAYNITESNSVKSLKGTLLLKEKLSLALETYKEKLSLSVLKLYRNTWRNNSVPTEWGVYDMAVGKK